MVTFPFSLCKIINMDFTITSKINQYGSGTIIDNIAILVSDYYFLALSIILIWIIIFIWDRKNFKSIFVGTIIALVIHFIFIQFLIKTITVDQFDLFRLRPYLAHPGVITALGKLNTDSSFPSGHVSGITVFLVVIVWKYPKFVWAAVFAVAVMAFARMHNGMHYFTDVLAGAGFGMIWGIIAIMIAKRILRKKQVS